MRGAKKDPAAAAMTLFTEWQKAEGRAGLVCVCARVKEKPEFILDVLNSEVPNRYPNKDVK